jgi:hypothetical protein
VGGVNRGGERRLSAWPAPTVMARPDLDLPRLLDFGGEEPVRNHRAGPGQIIGTGLVHSGVSHQVPQSLRLWIAEEAHLQPLAVDRYDQPFEPLELCLRIPAIVIAQIGPS